MNEPEQMDTGIFLCNTIDGRKFGGPLHHSLKIELSKEEVETDVDLDYDKVLALCGALLEEREEEKKRREEEEQKRKEKKEKKEEKDEEITIPQVLLPLVKTVVE